jgi:ribosomal protein L11 methyltransferase
MTSEICSIASRTCLGRNWPALDVHTVGNDDLVLMILDDFQPTAVEERPSSLRAFFSSAASRDAACEALCGRYPVEPVDVADEDWARRSQESLGPVTVGRLTILPRADVCARDQTAIVIKPSTGFGTGHHASTRLCLSALQSLDLDGATMLDTGTGSGILPIAAARLGARRAIGIDNDPDAVQAARDNLRLNPDARNVTFDLGDVMTMPLPPADIVTANLTGFLIARIAGKLARTLQENGTLIVSGILADERAEMVAAFANSSTEPISESREDEWLCLMLRPLEAGR